MLRYLAGQPHLSVHDAVTARQLQSPFCYALHALLGDEVISSKRAICSNPTIADSRRYRLLWQKQQLARRLLRQLRLHTPRWSEIVRLNSANQV